MSPYDTYSSPLASRNASLEMLRLWSPRHKFNTWRRIWLAVAEAMHELSSSEGAPSASSGSPAPLVTKEQVDELRAVVSRGITDAEIQAAEKYEQSLRHDVMAHVHALADSCPKARPIIHLGMTSQDVVCNADLRTVGQSFRLVKIKLARLIGAFADKATQTTRIPTLGFTHFQPAQPVTVGRRIAAWAADLNLCHSKLHSTWWQLQYRGLRGATGTQAAFEAILDDCVDVRKLEIAFFNHFADDDPFPTRDQPRQSLPPYYPSLVSGPRVANVFALTGQTYPRVIDTFILADLASVASVLHKIATDIRLLCNRKELDEPFEDKQVGSSAMPYKRNPMRCERICGLTRFVMNLVGNAYDTAATQWLERTLDDSSNRRLSLPEAFLALDGALDLMHNVASGLIVHEAMVKKNLMAELPFLATENILMECVKAGADRQATHEKIRVHAQAAGMRVKQQGLDNDLLARLQADPAFHTPALRHELDWSNLLDPIKYVGRSVEQTERFLKEVVDPLRAQYADAIAKLGDTSPRV